ncbi:unnamed protein product [Cercopithifilaria johnstoni]|uniref:Uncharacterized protein n=1 Tax=Cercopithifilaria johnstoni TaxID=2874296 RepID=A0A8J2M844_9BILA|nr:unnamed protein product [Cercopithifilaria johnstoni]
MLIDLENIRSFVIRHDLLAHLKELGDHDWKIWSDQGNIGDFKDFMDELLSETLRNGINHIDPADHIKSYRSYRSILTSAKLGRFELDFSRPYDYRIHILLDQLTISLKRLKLVYMDMYYL